MSKDKTKEDPLVCDIEKKPVSKKKMILLLVVAVAAVFSGIKIKDYAEETHYKNLLEEVKAEEWMDIMVQMRDPENPIYVERLEEIATLQKADTFNLFENRPSKEDPSVGSYDWMDEAVQMVVLKNGVHMEMGKNSDHYQDGYTKYYQSEVDLIGMTDVTKDVTEYLNSGNKKEPTDVDFYTVFGFDYHDKKGIDAVKALFDYCGLTGYDSLDGSKLDKEYYYEWGQEHYFLPTDSKAFDDLEGTVKGKTIVEKNGVLAVGSYKGEKYPGYISIEIISEDENVRYYDYMYVEIQFNDLLMVGGCDCGCGNLNLADCVVVCADVDCDETGEHTHETESTTEEIRENK